MEELSDINIITPTDQHHVLRDTIPQERGSSLSTWDRIWSHEENVGDMKFEYKEVL